MKCSCSSPARIVVLAVTLALMLAFTGAPASAHEDPAYSHDASTGESNPNWMGSVSNVPLSELSIPGTHDSGAFVFGGDTTETQSMDINAQLQAGIRMFDIRLGYFEGSVCDVAGPLCPCPGPALWVFHGFSCQDKQFISDVLAPTDAFLQFHPTETILMRVKQDQGSGDQFDERVLAALGAYSSRLYKGASDNPSLNDMRGKIVILQNFTGDLSSVTNSLPWDGAGQDIQDNYSMAENWDLATKWRLAPDGNNVLDQLNDANDMSDDAGVIHINFLSAAGGGFPYFFASGHSSHETGAPRLATGWTTADCYLYDRCLPEYPRLSCVGSLCSVYFEGINILARDHIGVNVKTRAGIVMADFPGRSLISAIINVNPTNLPPEITATGSTAAEGSPATVSGMITDPDLGDTFTLTIDWGDGGQPETYSYPAGTTTYSVQHIYVDDNPAGTASDVYPVFVTVTDNEGASDDAETSVTVTNAAPIVTAASATIPENSVATVSGTITDPGVEDAFNLVVDWGDGSPNQNIYLGGTTSFSLQHQYPDDDPTGTAVDVYQIIVTIVDDDTGLGIVVTTVTVNNVAPVASFDAVMDSRGNLIGPVPPNALDVVLEGLELAIAASFSDVGALDTHVGKLDWNDGAVWTGPVTGQVTGSHVYTEPGVYRAAVTVTDDDTSAITVWRDIEVVSAEGALQDVIEDLYGVLADPATDPSTAALIAQALDELDGQNGGAADNGAIDLTRRGAWNAAMDKIRKAVKLLEPAGQYTAVSQLVMTAKAIVVELIEEAQATATQPRELEAIAEAQAWIAQGDVAASPLEAIDAYRWALVAIRPG